MRSYVEHKNQISVLRISYCMPNNTCTCTYSIKLSLSIIDESSITLSKVQNYKAFHWIHKWLVLAFWLKWEPCCCHFKHFYEGLWILSSWKHPLAIHVKWWYPCDIRNIHMNDLLLITCSIKHRYQKGRDMIHCNAIFSSNLQNFRKCMICLILCIHVVEYG